MPAPTKGQIKVNLETSLIAAGFTEKIPNEDGTTTDTGKLHEAQQKYVDALADGIHNTWTQWQTAQTVVVTGAQPGTGVVPGTLP